MLRGLKPARAIFALALTTVLAAGAVAQVTPYTGNAGGPGGPFDVLFVNGSAGGAERTVLVGHNKPFTIDLNPVGSIPPGAQFMLFAFFAAPGASDVRTLPFGVGDMAFPICPLEFHPLSITVSDPIGLGCGEILPSTGVPWALPIPTGLPAPLAFGLQAIILDPAGTLGFAVTNCVTVRIIPTPEVIFTKIGGDPSAIVPGAADLAGNPAVTEFRAMEGLVGSSTGSHWLLRGRTQLGSDLETTLLAGQGAFGTTVAQEGRPIPGSATELYDFFGSGLGTFNDNNDYAFSARARGGPSGTLQKVIRSIGGVHTVVFREGDPYTGMVDVPANPQGDEIVGNSVGSVHLLNNGVIGSQDSTILNIHTSRRPAITYDRVMFHQIGVTTITSLDGLSTETWGSGAISGGGPLANFFYTTPDGAHWMAVGQITQPNNATDGVLVRDGQVIMQEGNLIPGSSIVAGASVTANPFLGYLLASNGDYIVRGSRVGGHWAAFNGAIVANTGDPIVPGSSEVWGATLSGVSCNQLGEYIVFGPSTGGAGTANDDVVVLNGTTVVLREGDPVDLDGNGFFDDDVFIGRGNNTLTSWSANNAFISDDRYLYIIVNLRNGAGVDLNTTLPVFGTPNAFIRVKLP